MTGSTPSDAPVLPGRRARLAALCAMLAIYFCSYFQRAAIPGTVFNEIQTDLRLSASAVTSLAALYTYVYGGAQLCVGFAADRFGGVRVLLAGGALMTVGAVAFPLSHSLVMLYLSRILTALGGSVMYLSIVKEICLLFPPQRFATLLGVSLAVGYSGGVMGMLPFERIVAWAGWRQALLGMGAATVLALGVAWWILRRFSGLTPPARSFSLKPLAAVLRHRDNWPLFCLVSINFPTYFVIQTVLGKKFLQDCSGLSSAAAAVFTTLMMCTTALITLSTGLLLPRTGNRRKPWIWLGAGLLLGAVALMLAGVAAHAGGGVFLLAYLLLALSMAASPAITATMKELNDPGAVAVAVAVINSLSYLGAGVVGNAAGAILDRFRDRAVVTGASTMYPSAAYAAVFAFLAGLAVLHLAVTWRVRETHGRARVGQGERPAAPETVDVAGE